jgi:pyridoxal phosphate enzyme (YggS family)
VNDLKTIQRNWQEVQARIATAARAARRELSEVRLVVVTKGHPAQAIQNLHDLGVRDIGESYVEEGYVKQVALSGLAGLKWHMIGHVQSRKADVVAANYDMLHSLDSVKLARRLDRFVGEAGGSLPVLLECNVSGEASKYGFPAQDEKNRTALYAEVEEMVKLPRLRIQGLMTIAPLTDSGDEAKPHFARLRELRDQLKLLFDQADWSELSMGMSDDYEAAIAEGATLLRIGTAILGSRPA